MPDMHDAPKRRKRRKASWDRYRRKKKRKVARKVAKPKVKIPRRIKGSHKLTVSLSTECIQCLALLHNKSRFVEGAIMDAMKRIYAKHGKPWVDWPY